MRLLITCLLLSFTIFSQQEGLRIVVDDVVPATAPYNEFESHLIIEQNMNHPVLVSSSPNQLIIPSGTSSFLQTVHLAYAQHHDLVLSPDDIWIQIALGVSIHVNQNFGTLQPKVTRSAKKEVLNIRMDELATKDPNHWQQLVDTFALLAEQKIQPAFYKTMLPDFSTSTPETRTVLNALLLSSVKESLELRSASGCGIPGVVLLGTKADWEKILVHLDELNAYDLQFWTAELKPIIQEFINVFDGKENRAFWQRMYKYREAYMMMQMNGWLSKFFPYFKEGDWIDDESEIAQYLADNPGIVMDEGLVRTKYYRNPYLTGDAYLFHSIDLWDLPSSICDIPLEWTNYFQDGELAEPQKLTLCAGFFGSLQDENLKLHQHPAWFILESDYVELDYDNWKSSGKNRVSFAPYLWSDSLINDARVNAIYHPEVNKTMADGIKELKAELEHHLAVNSPNERLYKTEIYFQLSHFGHIIAVFFNNSTLSEAAKIELELKLKKLNYTFLPTQLPSGFADDEEMEQEENLPSSIPSNSVIVLQF